MFVILVFEFGEKRAVLKWCEMGLVFPPLDHGFNQMTFFLHTDLGEFFITY